MVFSAASTSAFVFGTEEIYWLLPCPVRAAAQLSGVTAEGVTAGRDPQLPALAQKSIS